jgi:hypothetical protein
MSVAEHVARWQENLGLPNRPPLEINPYVYTANNPLRWIDFGGFESDSPNAGNANFPDPSVPEPGLESPCIECIIIPAARAGKVIEACKTIIKNKDTLKVDFPAFTGHLRLSSQNRRKSDGSSMPFAWSPT